MCVSICIGEGLPPPPAWSRRLHAPSKPVKPCRGRSLKTRLSCLLHSDLLTTCIAIDEIAFPSRAEVLTVEETTPFSSIVRASVKMKLTMRRREVVVRKRWFVNEQEGFAVVHLRSIIDKVGVDSRTPQMNLEDVIILLLPMSENVTFMTRVMEFDPDTNLIGFKLLEMTTARFGLRQLDDFEAMLSSPETVKGLEPLPKPL
ncbi:hypothetical protein Pmar_PMAR022207 [Perkinsus marinus ATCC 50983]|uniref:Uncharacterized protein n=1 Tax=Perkinsus marinus (strain ATCC 50983 / TXsc) TaxID=423536 RepID=C5LKE8_PERM5|nr:hypothetical protein Pmar_PMAR022207 [Perkinsus marinus ATCC 50983]EER02782.1 hypothetical protein Pmar_PMAR022207 [Perkinsus marinus ATCC 50983]|eukprot:XP_002770966.1 hypothetical protein Pmar_PMAR022207 [Perkinsus marinus ATCC 50983]